MTNRRAGNRNGPTGAHPPQPAAVSSAPATHLSGPLKHTSARIDRSAELAAGGGAGVVMLGMAGHLRHSLAVESNRQVASRWAERLPLLGVASEIWSNACAIRFGDDQRHPS